MAEVTVDKLRVEVKATAEGANKVFEQLEKQLKTLKSSASGFNISGLTNLTNALNKVSTSLDTLSSKIQTVNGKTVTPKINTDGVTSSQKKIDNSISKIRESLAGLTAYGNAAMGGDSSALTSFDRRVTSIQSSIDVLKTKISSLGNTNIKVNAIEYYEAKIEKARDAIDQLVIKENEFKANGTDSGEAWDNLQAKLSETRDQLDALIQEQSKFKVGDIIEVDSLEEQKAALADFQSQLTTTSNTVHSAVSSMNGQPIDIPTQESQSGLSTLKSLALSTASSLYKIADSAVTSAFSKLSSSINSVKSSITSLKSKVNSLNTSFNKGFINVLKYAFGIRSLYVLFRRLRQAVKDSFTELQKSGAYYETTKANIDALKDSLSILKYQFGAAFETVFNTVAPALQTFINYLISAMNTLSAFIAKLTGKSTYSKAVKATADIAGNAGSAANSAKEMAKQLQGFDELNNLSGTSSGGSGGGSGSSGSSSGITYVTESVDNALGSFTNALSDSIKNGDWEGVGTLLSTKLTEMMKKVKWNDIYKKAENFGTNLALFLNGLFSTDENGENVFTSTGETIASALNTALKFLNSFGTTFKWKDFGSSMASGINKFFTTFKFAELGDAVHTWVGGILDAGIQLLTDTDFELIGTKLGDFLEHCQLGDLASKLKELAIQVIKGLGQAITGLKKSDVPELELGILAVLGTLAITKSIPATLTIAAALAGIYLGTKYYEIMSGNTVDQSFLEEVGDILEGFFGENSVKINIAEAISFVWSELTGQNNEETPQWQKSLQKLIGDALSSAMKLGWIVNVAEFISFDWSSFKTNFVNSWKALWNGSSFSETGANGMPSDVADTLSEQSSGLKATLKTYGKDIWEGVKAGFKTTVDDWLSPVTDLFNAIVGAIKKIFGINSPAEEMKPYGKYMLEGIAEGFENAFSELSDKIKELPGKIKAWFEEHFKGFSLSDTLSGVIGTVGDTISVGVELAKKGWDTVTKWVNDAKQFGKDVIRGSVGLIQQGWSTVTNWLNETRQKGSGAISVFVGLAKAFGAGITTVKEWLTKNGGDSTITSNVSLTKSFGTGIASIADWLYKNGGSYTIQGLVNLKKQFGNTIASWIYANGGSKVVTGLVDLDKKFGNSIAAWLNANGGSKVVTGMVNLKKNLIDGTKKAWSTVGQMVEYVSTKSGMKTNAIVNLTTAGSNWNSYSSVGDWVTKKGWVGSVSLKVNLTSGWTGTIAEWLVKMFGGAKQNANGTFTVGPFTAQASGGSFFGGKWHNIPQFASGTFNALKHGSIFAAGEKGPEVVGHINGRTEVLNRSQLASTMNSAIVKGMAQFRNMQFNPDIETLYSNFGVNTDYANQSYRDNDTAIMEQNRLLAEQNRLLEQILQKPTGISKREVFEATRSESNNYFNRTGNSPFLY